jgi:hypothetical protein
MAEVRAEIGDAIIYLIELSEKLESNPVQVTKGKLEIKYPATLVKGKASKYREVSRFDLLQVHRDISKG